MDLLVLVGSVVLAWLAWKYPGRRCGSDACARIGRAGRQRRGLR